MVSIFYDCPNLLLDLMLSGRGLWLMAYETSHGNQHDVNRLNPSHTKENQFNSTMLDRIPLIRFLVNLIYDFLIVNSVSTYLRYRP